MTFDDDYTNGHVVRLFFGHNVGREDGRPFARKDVVITDAKGDTITGFEANARDKTHGSLDDTQDETKPSVRVKDTPIDVRKSAVIMKRDFGEVETNVAVATDKTGKYGNAPDHANAGGSA